MIIMDENREINEDLESLYIEIHKKEAEIQKKINKAQMAKLQKISEVKKKYQLELQDLKKELDIDGKKRKDEVFHRLQENLKEIDRECSSYYSQIEKISADKKEKMIELIIERLLKV